MNSRTAANVMVVAVFFVAGLALAQVNPSRGTVRANQGNASTTDSWPVKTGWDSMFSGTARWATADDTADNCVAVPANSYVKTTCIGIDGGGIDTFVGSGVSTTDGGRCLITSDAGSYCDLIRYSLGEKSYQQLSAGGDRVCILGFLGQTSYCAMYFGSPR